MVTIKVKPDGFNKVLFCIRWIAEQGKKAQITDE